MATQLPKPLLCLHHERFVRNDGWLLLDVSLSLSGHVAISGYNTTSHRTCLDIYVVRISGSMDKPEIIYSREFDKYQSKFGIHRGRCISFDDSNSENIVTCIGNKLNVVKFSTDTVLQSRIIEGSADCISVSQREIFIGFSQLCQVCAYDMTHLTKTKVITLGGTLPSTYKPYEMTAFSDKLVACVSYGRDGTQRTLIFKQQGGGILTELTTPKDMHWYKASVTISVSLGVVAVVRAEMSHTIHKAQHQVVFYSLLSKQNSSVPVFEVESGINRIRISDRGDKLATANLNTGQVKIYETAEVFSYNYMKSQLNSQFQRHDIRKFAKFVGVSNEETEVIMKRETPMAEIIHALEEKGILQPANIDKLMDALENLDVSQSPHIALKIYHEMKKQATLYDRFLVNISTHLTSSLPGDLCVYFNIPDAEKNSIKFSQNPSLSLMLTLDKINIINPSEVTALEIPLLNNGLVQAVAAIHDYQSRVEDERNMLHKKILPTTLADKRELFLQYVKRRLKSWYEAMTPVPWKRSCRWKSIDLFVPCRLMINDSKTKGNLKDIDEKCKLSYKEIFCHDKLRNESIVCVEGDPGSGKTMLVSQLAFEWSQGAISGINLLILLPLKFFKEETIVEAIKAFYLPEEQRLSVTDIQDVMKNEGNGCCIVLDGLEEYSGDYSCTTKKPSGMLKMVCKMFPSCKVLFTTRSDFAHGIATCPVLKIGQFGEYERNAYIEKLFSDDVEKQVEVKKVLEDTPLILDLCNVPLLFVLAVHTLASKENVGETHFQRVSPFMQNIVKSLVSISTLVGNENIVLLSTKEQHRVKVTQSHHSNFPHALNPYLGKIAQKEFHGQMKHTTSNSDNFEKISLEMLAFNGLCRGYQQLAWPKHFVDENVLNIRCWMDSGILIAEEASTSGKSPQNINSSSQGDADVEKSFERAVSSTFISSDKRNTVEHNVVDIQKEGITKVTQVPRTETISTTKPENQSESQASCSVDSEEIRRKVKHGTHQDLVEYQDSQDTSSSSKRENAKSPHALGHVPLQVKFLHKIVQEWFAAVYLANRFWQYTEKSLPIQSKLLRKHLRLINPADLHYLLRFTCYLCPPSCHLIVNHLLEMYRKEDGTFPEYILNCICLCLTEHNDEDDHQVKDVVRKLCTIALIIQPGDSRILQQSKINMMKIGSSSGFPISELHLQDVVVKAMERELELNSGATIETLHTLQEINISRWDQTLTEEDYSNVLKFIANCASIKDVCLHFPEEPPKLDDVTMTILRLHVQTVTWKIGSLLKKNLDITTGEWQILSPTTKHTQKQQDLKDNTTIADLHAEEYLDERGGTLVVKNANITLHVPAGALSQGLWIRVTVPMDPSPYLTDEQTCPRVTPLIIFEPDDMRFDLPVEVTLPHCAVVKNVKDHRVVVKFGYRVKKYSKEMIWTPEPVRWTVGESFCSLWLDHFSGVDASITAVEEKILRVIPYAIMRRSNKIALNVWLCNDLESDFQSVVKSEEINEGIPLDSYDTFQLNSGDETFKVTVDLEKMQEDEWELSGNKILNVERLAYSSKSKSSFFLRRTSHGCDDDDEHIYLLLRITQNVGGEERDTTFAIRKRICDLRTVALFKKPCNQSKLLTDHLFSTELRKRPYTAVVYMDPVKDLKDDAILTVWLSPFDSNSKGFQLLEEEQELQLKHKVDTENSFVVFDEKVVVVSKTRFRSGQWNLSPEEKRIKTDRIKFGSRAKFQFICRRKKRDDDDCIDLEVEVFQEDKCKIMFTTDVEMDDLRYETRRRKMRVSASSVSEDSLTCLSGAQGGWTPVPDTLSFPNTDSVTNRRTSASSVVSIDPSFPQPEEKPVAVKDRLQEIFMLLKKSISTEWRDLGLYLEISDDILNQLQEDNKDKIGKCVYNMLQTWKKSNGSEATTHKLINALKKCGRRDLAEKVADLDKCI